MSSKEILALLCPTTLQDNRVVSSYLSSILKTLICRHHKNLKVDNKDGIIKMFLQSIFSKLGHLILLSEGIDYYNRNNEKLIDPTGQIILSRSIFESVVFFNLLNIYHQKDEEKNLIYNLWKHSTLMYRQRFRNDNSSEKVKQLLDDEKQEVEELKIFITSSPIYLNSCDKSQHQVDRAIKHNKYWIEIIDGKINSSKGPEYLCSKMTMNSPLVKQQYTRFSQFTHPSKESLDFLCNIYQDDEYKEMSAFNLRVTNCLVAMFITDYVCTYPECKEFYEEMPLEHQAVCSWYNRQIRSENSSINKAYEELI